MTTMLCGKPLFYFSLLKIVLLIMAMYNSRVLRHIFSLQTISEIVSKSPVCCLTYIIRRCVCSNGFLYLLHCLNNQSTLVYFKHIYLCKKSAGQGRNSRYSKASRYF